MAKTKELHFEDAIEHHLDHVGWLDQGQPQGLRPPDGARLEGLLRVRGGDPTRDVDRAAQASPVEPGGVSPRHTGQGARLRGSLDVLRHGFKFFGKKIECAYFKPAHGMNPDILAKYAKNRLVVTRQVRFIEDGEESVDLALFVNGFPSRPPS